MGTTQRGLVVGNYCHDVLLKDNLVLAESLGGAASFISNIFTNLHVTTNIDYISKVGPDFKYHPSAPHPPLVDPTSLTTLFHAHFTSLPAGPGPTSDRALTRVTACGPVLPEDLPCGTRYRFGMAVGVGGEITVETMEKMVEICDVVFVDIQGLIREFDEVDGSVRLVKLEKTGFYPLLSKIGVLKASAEEAEYVDLEEVRKLCCVVVTRGEEGCRVYWKDGEVEIAPFSAFQVDPTGAGDSLLGGFVAGLMHGLSVPDAALLGNFFGSLTVGQIGLPKFDPKLLQRVKDEMQKRLLQCGEHSFGDKDELCFSKPPGHEQFHISLNAARQAYVSPAQECVRGLPNLHNHATRPLNHSINHQCSGPKFLHDAVYDEPIESLNSAP